MNEQDNKKVVEQLYNAFETGDMTALLRLLATDIEWRHPRGQDIPWGGMHKGHQGVIEFFRVISEAGEVMQFLPGEYVAEGDKVMVLGHERIRVKSTGLVYETDWVHEYTLRDHKVIKFSEYTDTASIIDALKGK
ncbi:MAG: nuclear transport factor 2 family protein [Nitrospirae bacterium]|nr:nuclear transport factor 2 family protein [Nitrospirota bacterium]